VFRTGAGPDDMLDVFPGKKARFVRNFMKAHRASPTRGALPCAPCATAASAEEHGF